MANIDVAGGSSGLTSIIVNTERRAKATQARAWLTRSQIIDLSVLLDALIVFASFAIAVPLYVAVSGGELLREGANYTLASVFAGLVHYVVTRTGRGKSEQLKSSSFGQVLRLLMITFAAVIVLGYGLKQAEMHSRLWLGLAFTSAFALIALKNWILNVLIDTGHLQEFVEERIALFGDPSMAGLLKSSLEREHDNMCRIRIYDGNLSDSPSAEQPDLSRLIADGLDHAFDRVIFCLPAGQLPKLKDLVDAIDFLPGRIEVCLAQTELQLLRSTNLASPSQLLVSLDERQDNDWSRLLKRVMDLVLGSVILVLATPIMLLAALAIKLDTEGPVFFRQRRHGWNHSVISVWKFRSMGVLEDGPSVQQAVADDKRITRVGRFLRRTSLDELPQLFNVLKGDMSLVGPRPHALAHNLHYSDLIARYASRHKVKPGLTGWAQIKGLRGNSAEISKMVARAEADVWYIKHWSLLLDLRIITMTPFVMLFHKEAV